MSWMRNSLKAFCCTHWHCLIVGTASCFTASTPAHHCHNIMSEAVKAALSKRATALPSKGADLTRGSRNFALKREGDGGLIAGTLSLVSGRQWACFLQQTLRGAASQTRTKLAAKGAIIKGRDEAIKGLKLQIESLKAAAQQSLNMDHFISYEGHTLNLAANSDFARVVQRMMGFASKSVRLRACFCHCDHEGARPPSTPLSLLFLCLPCIRSSQAPRA